MKLMLAIAVGGSLGAVARYGMVLGVGRLTPGWHVPWATMLVNVTGSFLLGLAIRVLAPLPAGSAWRGFVAVGLLGAFTTFSTYSYEGILLLQSRDYARAVVYLAGSVLMGLLALLAGLWLGGLTQRN